MLKTGEVSISREDLLPFNLILKEFTEVEDLVKNIKNFDEWCSDRILPLGRKYAKKIYNVLGFQQSLSVNDKAKFARSCSCVSLVDYELER